MQSGSKIRKVKTIFEILLYLKMHRLFQYANDNVIIKYQNNGYIYIYIVIHRQTVSFYQNSSMWLDM